MIILVMYSTIHLLNTISSTNFNQNSDFIYVNLQDWATIFRKLSSSWSLLPTYYCLLLPLALSSSHMKYIYIL